MNSSLIKLTKKILRVVFLFFLIVSSNLFSLPTKSVAELTQVEKESLERLFSTLFEGSTAGYVLYGVKPIFLSSYQIVDKDSCEYEDWKSYNWLLTKGIEVLEEFKLKNSDYCIVTYDVLNQPSQREIMFINKKALLKAIKRNLSIFHSQLNIQSSPQVILNNILSSSFRDFFKGKEGLQGIVLGYGTDNALAYETANKLMSEAEKNGALTEVIQSNMKMEDFEKEVKRAVITYAKCNLEKWSDAIISLENFAYFDEIDMKNNFNVKIPFSYLPQSKESNKLIKSYIKAEQKVSKIRNDKCFLEKNSKRLNS